MDYRSPPPEMVGMWERTRGLRRAFLAGLVIGALGGWFFHGLVSLLVRFGLALLLLVPVAIIAWLWWRIRNERSRQRSHGGSPTVMTWNVRGFPGQHSGPQRRGYDAREQADAGDDVYDLDELKRQLERDR